MSDAGPSAHIVRSTFIWGMSCVFWVGAALAYIHALRGNRELSLALLCLVVGRFVAVLVHESGHAVAAKICGWRLIVFMVWPFAFQVPNRNPVLLRRRNRTTAGHVVIVPGSAKVDTRSRLALIYAAGAIAGLVLGILAWLASVMLLRGVVVGSLSLGEVSIGICIQTVHLSLLSILPSSKPKGMTDGQFIRWFYRPDFDYRRDRSLAWLAALLSKNVRLRDLPAWLVERASRDPGAATEANLQRYLDSVEIGRVLDQDDVDVARARALIDDYRARYGDGGWLAACDVYLATIWEGRQMQAEDLIVGGEPPAPEELRLAALAAIAARRGDASETCRLLAAMRRQLRLASPYPNPTFKDIQRRIEGLLARTP